MAFVLAFVGALVAAVTGRETIDGMGAFEWLVVVATAVVTASATYTVPNSAR